MNSAATPTSEQEQRAKWDLLLLDLELRAEQVRQLKRYEPLRLTAVLTTTVIALGGAIGTAIHFLSR